MNCFVHVNYKNVKMNTVAAGDIKKWSLSPFNSKPTVHATRATSLFWHITCILYVCTGNDAILYANMHGTRKIKICSIKKLFFSD